MPHSVHLSFGGAMLYSPSKKKYNSGGLLHCAKMYSPLFFGGAGLFCYLICIISSVNGDAQRRQHMQNTLLCTL